MFWVGPTCSPTPSGRWIPEAFSAQAKMIFSTPPHRHIVAPLLQLLKEWHAPIKTSSTYSGTSQNTLLLSLSLPPPPFLSLRKKAWDTLFLHLFSPVPSTVVHCYTLCDEI